MLDNLRTKSVRVFKPFGVFKDNGIYTVFVSVGLCAIALMLRLAIAPVEAGIQYVTFFPAVTLAAVISGYSGGLITTVLGMAMATYVFTPPYYSLSMDVLKTAFWSNVVFFIDGLIVSCSIEGLIRFRRQFIQKFEEACLANAKLADSSRQFQDILDNLFAYVALLDIDGKIVEMNKAPLKRAGYARDDVIGRYFHEIPCWSYDVETQKKLKASIDAARTGQSLRYDVIVKLADELVPTDFQISPVRDGTGKIVGLLPTGVDITERKIAENKLRESAIISHQASVRAKASEAHLKSIFDASPDALLISNDKGRIVMANQRFESLLGYTAEELLDKPVDVLVPARFRVDHPSMRTQFIATPEGRKMGNGRSIWALRKNGTEVEVEISLSNVQTDWGSFIASAMHDITERKRADLELRIAATAFESQESTMVTDESGVILKINQAFTRTTGYDSDEIVGKRPSILKSGRHDREFYAAMWETINRTGGWAGEIWDRRKDGSIYPKWLNIVAVKNPKGEVTNYIGTHTDISARKQAEEKINALAYFDQLTGLPNRTLLVDRLNQVLSASSRTGAYGALLFIDLDNFKTINDTLGHDTGDELLKLVADRLNACVRAGDTVARLGGDEFILMLAGLSALERGAASQVDAVGEKILELLNLPFQLHKTQSRCTPSIGVALFRGQGNTVDELLKQADIAMYKSKAAGRNAIHFFDPEMESAMVQRAELEADLRGSLENDHFVIFYQPQVMNEKTLSGAEALVRWKHPSRGMVSPADFIPLAEETGLILPLGIWVLETACKQLATWADQPRMSGLRIAVNISAHQIRQPNFVELVLNIVNETGANPNRLKLELTESLMVENIQDIIEKMEALNAAGVTFSLDDFGTGYSSLSYLKLLPLKQLKIDQSFVRDVLTDPNDAAIARTVVSLGESLGLDVIAEGVETKLQRDFLAKIGCHAYQGYFFSRPLPLEAFEEFANRF